MPDLALKPRGEADKAGAGVHGRARCQLPVSALAACREGWLSFICLAVSKNARPQVFAEKNEVVTL